MGHLELGTSTRAFSPYEKAWLRWTVLGRETVRAYLCVDYTTKQKCVGPLLLINGYQSTRVKFTSVKIQLWSYLLVHCFPTREETTEQRTATQEPFLVASHMITMDDYVLARKSINSRVFEVELEERTRTTLFCNHMFVTHDG